MPPDMTVRKASVSIAQRLDEALDSGHLATTQEIGAAEGLIAAHNVWRDGRMGDREYQAVVAKCPQSVLAVAGLSVERGQDTVVLH